MPTKIPWCDETINPWVGCTKCRAGCRNCYAERVAYRLAAMGQVGYQIALDGRQWSGRIAYQMEQLDKLKHWHKERRVFMGSMTDIFHEAVPFSEIAKVFDAMYENTQHTYIIATKRPDRALAFAQWVEVTESPKDQWADHIHLLISCSTQKDLDEMAPVLFHIPAAVRGVSLEPLISNVSFRWASWCKQTRDSEGGMWLNGKLVPSFDQYDGLRMFNWVVVGAESGPKRRPCDIEWVRSIVGECTEAGVPVYVKQLSLPGCRKCGFDPCTHLHGHKQIDILVTDPKDFPEDLRIREIP